MARRHMLQYGTTREQLALAAATVRNNGHVNPGVRTRPFTPADILESVADPFLSLPECSMTSEGGCGLVLTTARATAIRHRSRRGSGSASGMQPSVRRFAMWDL